MTNVYIVETINAHGERSIVNAYSTLPKALVGMKQDFNDQYGKKYTIEEDDESTDDEMIFSVYDIEGFNWDDQYIINVKPLL